MTGLPVLKAIRFELAREREQGRSIECIRVSSAALEGSVITVPKVQGTLGTLQSALRLIAGKPAREMLVHPNDWERLIGELQISERMGEEVEAVVGLPIEHSK